MHDEFSALQMENHDRIAASFLKTTFNGLNALSGVGILSIPYALSSGGGLSLLILFLVAGSTFYTGLLIRRCMEMSPNIRTYPDIGERAFGPIGRTLISFVMHIELYLVATGFLIVGGDNLHKLFPHIRYELAGLVLGGQRTFIFIVSLVLPTVWLHDVASLSYISATGSIASIILIGSILWAGVFDGIGFHENVKLFDYKGIPSAISMYMFCYCAHPVFPTLYTSMKNKRKFSKVLIICFGICTISYASMALLGYFMFGSRVQSQITLNLPTHKTSSKVAIYTTIINPLTKYALMLNPIVGALETRLLKRPNKCVSILIRTSLVLSSVIVAMALPFFEYLMSFVGAFTGVTASIFLPCLCYCKISGIHKRLGFESVSIIVILLMGVFVLVLGTYTSIREIVEHL